MNDAFHSNNQAQHPRLRQTQSNQSTMSMHSGNTGHSANTPSLNQQHSNTSKPSTTRSKSPHKKQRIAAMTRDEKKGHWERLRDYTSQLIAQSENAPRGRGKAKYNHPPEMIALFETVGLRAPKSLKGAVKLNDNFIERIKLLNPSSNNSGNKQTQQQRNQGKWQPKGTAPRLQAGRHHGVHHEGSHSHHNQFHRVPNQMAQRNSLPPMTNRNVAFARNGTNGVNGMNGVNAMNTMNGNGMNGVMNQAQYHQQRQAMQRQSMGHQMGHQMGQQMGSFHDPQRGPHQGQFQGPNQGEKQRLYNSLPRPACPQRTHTQSLSMGALQMAAFNQFNGNHHVNTFNSRDVNITNTVSVNVAQRNVQNVQSVQAERGVINIPPGLDKNEVLRLYKEQEALHKQQAHIRQQSQLQTQSQYLNQMPMNQHQMNAQQMNPLQMNQQHLINHQLQLQQAQQAHAHAQAQVQAQAQAQRQQQQRQQQQQQQIILQQQHQQRGLQRIQMNQRTHHQSQSWVWAVSTTQQQTQRTSLPPQRDRGQFGAEILNNNPRNGNMSDPASVYLSSGTTNPTPTLSGSNAQSTNDGVAIVPMFLPHVPSPHHYSSQSASALPVSPQSFGPLLSTNSPHTRSSSTNSASVAGVPQIVLFPIHPTSTSIPLPSSTSPPNALPANLMVTTQLSPPNGQLSLINATSPSAPSASARTMERIDEEKSTATNTENGYKTYNDIANEHDRDQKAGGTPGTANTGNTNMIAAALMTVRYPNYSPNLEAMMRESASFWTVTPSGRTGSLQPLVGVKNALDDRTNELFTFLMEQCGSTVLLIPLDMVSSRSVSLNSRGLTATGLGIENRVSAVDPIARYSLTSASHIMAYSQNHSISEITDNLSFDFGDQAMPTAAPVMTILESKSMISEQLQKIDIPANSTLAPPLEDHSSKSSSGKKSARTSQSGPHSNSAQYGSSHRSNGSSGSTRLSGRVSALISGGRVSSNGQTSSNHSNGRMSLLSPASKQSFDHIAPHNDLNALMILEPIGAFETLELFRERTSDEALKEQAESYRTTLRNGLASCVEYLKHRMKLSTKNIEIIYFVAFAMPNPGPDVCQKWYEWSDFRSSALRQAVEDCKRECVESKMKPEFVCCTTPLPSKSFAKSGNTGINIPRSLQMERSDKGKASPWKEEDWVRSEKECVASSLPFKLRRDIASEINQKFHGRMVNHSKLSARFNDIPEVDEPDDGNSTDSQGSDEGQD